MLRESGTAGVLRVIDTSRARLARPVERKNIWVYAIIGLRPRMPPARGPRPRGARVALQMREGLRRTPS